MSKFIDAITAELTGRKFAKPWSPLKLSVKNEPCTSFESRGYLNEYKIEAAWRLMVRCEPEALDVIMKGVIRELKGAIYGDLMERLIRCERALYEHDIFGAREKMSEIMREIFGD